MVSIIPVSRALVPVDDDAATALSAPNYDEFQGDREVFDLICQKPESVLRVTMPHCDVSDFDERPRDGSLEALQRAGENMRSLIGSPRMRPIENLLWVYEIVSPKRPDVRQLGLGGLARTDEIRTDANPGGVIIRNEGIRQEKADGRAKLLEATNADFGTVNCAVRDREGRLTRLLEEFAGGCKPDLTTLDEAGNTHRVWLVTDPQQQQQLTAQLGQEAAAYVADGNHRSAAAAALGKKYFLTVFFTTDRMRLEPYNRLVESPGLEREEFLRQLETCFQVQPLGPLPAFRPDQIHEIGLYMGGEWYRLRPRLEKVEFSDAAAEIDSEVLQKYLFDRMLGIRDARDERLNFVGGNKDSAYLKARVDAGEYAFALSLAPVTMEQFVAVCEQNLFMPPKSTWFDPKIRSGLVIALLD
jgi:uncharacterized protein (DUF1015 family)